MTTAKRIAERLAVKKFKAYHVHLHSLADARKLARVLQHQYGSLGYVGAGNVVITSAMRSEIVDACGFLFPYSCKISVKKPSKELVKRTKDFYAKNPL